MKNVKPDGKPAASQTPPTAIADDKPITDEELIHQNMQKQLVAAGFNKSVAGKYAQVVQRGFSVLANRVGMSAMDLLKRYSPSVVRELEADAMRAKTPTMALNQQAKPDAVQQFKAAASKAGVASDSPAISTAFHAKLSDKQKQAMANAGFVVNDEMAKAQSNATGKAYHRAITSTLRAGDFEEIKRIAEQPASIELTGNELGTYSGVRELIVKAKPYIETNLRGKQFTNDATGMQIRVGHDFSGKISNPRSYPNQLLLVPAIPEVIKYGSPVGELEPDSKGRRSIVGFQKFATTATIAGNRVVVVFDAKKTTDGNFYYEHHSFDIKKEPVGSSQRRSGERPTTDSTEIIDQPGGEVKDFFQSSATSSAALPDTIEIDGVQRPTTNNLGQPIHPTEEGARNFWKWFGDSKVVDAEGRPMVVYHGTNADFNEFRISEGMYGEGIYLGKDPEYSAGFADQSGGNIMPLYAKITGQGDGRILPDKRGGIFVAFSPTQIKSATGNRGTFDPNEPSILYQSENAGRLGRIFIGQNREMKISLFENADRSTFLHETGHMFLEIIADLAEQPDAPESVKRDFQTLLDDFGVKSRSEITTEHHEKFARGFERYLMEGKAPSLSLRRAFSVGLIQIQMESVSDRIRIVRIPDRLQRGRVPTPWHLGSWFRWRTILPPIPGL